MPSAVPSVTAPATDKNAPRGNRLLTGFVIVHFAALAVFFVDFKWYFPLVVLGTYFARMFWVTAGYHRYFSHRSFKTSRAFQFVLAFLTMSSGQRGVLWWAGNHRDHHKSSDQPQDIHSPVQRGFWWSHVGWILSDGWEHTNFDRVRDLAKYPELKWLDRWHWVPLVTYWAVMFAIGGIPLLVWGGLLSTVVVWHGAFTINSLGHMFGSTRYETPDASKNNFLLAILTCGEGWHNNHHHYQSAANQGFFWWEIDLTFYGLKALSWIGLVWDLRAPPAHVLAGQRDPIMVSLSPTTE